MTTTTRLAELDAMTGEGKILDALDLFYADNCTFKEMADGSQRTSRKAQHDHLSGFFASLRGFDGATCHGHAAEGPLTLSEWTFQMTAGDGSPIRWDEVLVRRWENGKVVEERFYNAGA